MTGILNLLAGSISSAIKDTYFNLVTLLLPGDGTNGAQNNTFLDSSTNNFTITRNGNTTQGTFSPFSQTGWGVYFDGNASCDLAVASTAQFNWGTSDFCIEAFVYPQSFPSAARIINFGDGIFNFEITSSGFLSYFQGTSYNATTGALATNTWTHCVITRQSGTIRMFANGVLVFTNTNTTSKGTSTANIGSFPAGGDTLLGYLSNLRVINGNVPTAYQTSSTTVGASIFTVPTTALTAVSGTALLTCQANRFVDNSGNNLSVTVGAGTPQVQAFSPFAPTAAYSAATNGGSGYFDGTGDYLSVASNTAFDIMGGSYTIEYWYYPVSVATAIMVDRQDPASPYTGYSCRLLNATAQTADLNWNPGFTGALSTTTAPIKINQWNHIAYTCDGTTLRIYANGNLEASTTTLSSSNYNGALTIGARATNTQPTNAYFSGFILRKGTASYTGSTYTVPTAPPTAITNTQLLLNFTNAGIIDATAKNDLETVGNAQISTTQSKFGGSSMSFDRTTSSRLVIKNINGQLSLGTSNFTVEAWIYMNTLPASNGYNGSYWILGGGPVSSNSGFDIAIGSTNLQVGLTSFSSLNISVAHGMSATTWYHVAVVRSGNTLYAFKDGVQLATASVTGVTVDPCLTGWAISAAEPEGATDANFNGYIDDLRVTRYARYTANFTPPTAALPLQ